MKLDKPSLAKALPLEMGQPITFRTERVEQLKLNNHMREFGKTESRLHQGEAELVVAIWARATGVALPAALTIQTPGHDAESMIVTKLQLQYCNWTYDWSIVLSGLNLRQTGAAGNKREYIHLPLRRTAAISKRDLAGRWAPVGAPQEMGATC